MAPSGRRTTSSTKRTTIPEAKTKKKTRRTQYKKKQKQQHVQQVKQHVEKAETMEDFVPSTSSTTKTTGSDFDQGTDHISTSSNNSGCSTPRAERFRIPEVVTCPPAPRKRRVVNPNCSLRRTPIAFFAPPDLELFFFFALRDISV